MSDDLTISGKTAEELMDLYFGFVDNEIGEIPEEDTEKAFTYLKAAANMGLPEAWAELGACYFAGLGVEPDEAKAHDLLEKAALKNVANAQMNLYLFMRDKAQTDEEKKDALYWLNQAVENNVPSALFETGSLYYHGMVHKQDYKKAYEYFLKAADAGSAEGFSTLGVMYQQGQYVDHNLKKSAEYFAKAAELGSITGLYNLGNAYMGGLGTDQNYKEAMNCFEYIIDLEEPFYLMPDLEDKQTRSDIAQVFHRIQVYDMLYPMAHHNLGVMYQQGLGTDENLTQALYHYMLAAENGFAQSCFQAGTMLYTGEGIKEPEPEKAFEYLNTALDAGIEEAKLCLSLMYYFGEGVEEDKQKGIAMVDDLIAKGNVQAIKIKNSMLEQN